MFGKDELLRDEIDKLLREKRDISRLQTELSLFYLLAENRYPFTPTKIKIYLEDFVCRDIQSAQDYIRQAIILYPELFSEYLAELIETINKTSDELTPEKQANIVDLQQLFILVMSHRYLCLEDDPSRIEFSPVDIKAYIADWLRGVELAKTYIVKTAKEDAVSFANGLMTLHDLESIEKVVSLINDEQINSNSVLLAMAMQTIVLGKTPQEKANGLDMACYWKGLSEVFGNKDTLINRFTNIIIESGALFFVTDKTYLTNFYRHINPHYHSTIATNTYLAALTSHDNEHKKLLNDLCILDRVIKESIQLPEKISWEIEKEDITVEFYISSLRRNVKAFENMATIFNPELFQKLFLEEIDYVQKSCPSSSEEMKNREEFYRELLKSEKMKKLSFYPILLTRANALLKTRQLLPIDVIVPSSSVRSTLATLPVSVVPLTRFFLTQSPEASAPNNQSFLSAVSRAFALYFRANQTVRGLLSYIPIPSLPAIPERLRFFGRTQKIEIELQEMSPKAPGSEL